MSRAFTILFPEIQPKFKNDYLYHLKEINYQKFEKYQYKRMLEIVKKLSIYELQYLDNYINSKPSIRYKDWNTDEKILHYFFSKSLELRYGERTFHNEDYLVYKVDENIKLILKIIDYSAINIKNMKRLEVFTWENYLIPYFYKKYMLSYFPDKANFILHLNLEIKTGKIFIDKIKHYLNAPYSEEEYGDFNYSKKKQIVVSEILDKIREMGNSCLVTSNGNKSGLDLKVKDRSNSGIANRAKRWILTSNTKNKVEWITEYFTKKNIIFPVNLNNFKNLSNTEKNNIIISILVCLENYEEFNNTNIAIHKNAKGNIIHLKNIQSAWNNYNAKSPNRHLMSARSSRRLNELAQLTNKSKEQCLMSAIENEIKFIQKFKYF